MTTNHDRYEALADRIEKLGLPRPMFGDSIMYHFEAVVTYAEELKFRPDGLDK